MQPTLRAPEHQVAGHRAINGQLGPLIDGCGRFYKPLQTKDRGAKEVAFYEAFSSDERIPNHIRKFLPKFYGTEFVEASDGSGLHPHLVLEDVVYNYTNPLVMDIKIGARTWYPQASEKYIQKCFVRDSKMSSVTLGFRISGFQVYGESGYWRPDKKITQYYTAEEVRLVLKKFASSKESPEFAEDPNFTLGSRVYGGLSGILSQLLELKAWFEDQTSYHLNSCSVLMFYDEEALSKGGDHPGPAIKLVDFAHAFEVNGVIDHNFLGGLCSFIKFISDILPTEDGCMHSHNRNLTHSKEIPGLNAA